MEKGEKFKVPIRKEKKEISYPELLDFSRKIWSKIEKGEKINLEDLKNRMAEIVVSFSPNFFSEYWENLISDYPILGYFPHHSLNVCLFSLAMGMERKYSQEKLIDLGIAALLHETGMIFVPKEILFANRELTADEKKVHINHHPIYGYEKLKEIEGVNEDVLQAVRQEHERADAKGYPVGDKDEQIHEWAKIIGLADTFEAMTHSRSFRKGRPANEVISEIIKVNGRMFTRSILKALLRQIGLYPIGTWVRLTTGEVAKVIRIIPNFPGRPEVEILFSSERHKLETPQEA